MQELLKLNNNFIPSHLLFVKHSFLPDLKFTYKHKPKIGLDQENFLLCAF